MGEILFQNPLPPFITVKTSTRAWIINLTNVIYIEEIVEWKNGNGRIGIHTFDEVIFVDVDNLHRGMELIAGQLNAVSLRLA